VARSTTAAAVSMASGICPWAVSRGARWWPLVLPLAANGGVRSVSQWPHPLPRVAWVSRIESPVVMTTWASWCGRDPGGRDITVRSSTFATAGRRWAWSPFDAGSSEPSPQPHRGSSRDADASERPSEGTRVWMGRLVAQVHPPGDAYRYRFDLAAVVRRRCSVGRRSQWHRGESVAEGASG
jgi:hypothetical protein